MLEDNRRVEKRVAGREGIRFVRGGARFEGQAGPQEEEGGLHRLGR
jgi:hypothetical protein